MVLLATLRHVLLRAWIIAILRSSLRLIVYVPTVSTLDMFMLLPI